MRVTETTLQELLGGPKQFRVPLFQRTYTWKERDHAHLWRDILRQYEQMEDEIDGGGHFIGSFVLAPAQAPATLPTYLVVDGQQRLTTLTLALAALRDKASHVDPSSYDRITNQYLMNQYARNDIDRWKFVPTDDDRPEYFARVAGEIPDREDGLISKAYRFFAMKMEMLASDGKALDLSRLESAIVAKLAIVDITAQQGDNVHRIFESLNATGVGLTQADLLRNYMFMLLPTRDRVVYNSVWRPMQDQLGAQNLEGLARVDLRRRGLEVRDDDVYRAQQERLRPLEDNEEAIEQEIRDLALRARHYGRILVPDLEDHSGVRRHLEFLGRWRATTTHPLIMYLYELREDGELTADEMEQVLLNVESFLVRRLLVGDSNKNLNRVFVRLVGHLRQEAGSVLETMRRQLAAERLNWTSDEDVRLAASTKPFYYYGRAEQRRMVLERLEESYGHREQAALADLQLSVEHILPQTLSDQWVSDLESLGEDAESVHRELVHTLGNLTLTAYNSALSNLPIERKNQIYSASHLSMNGDLAANDGWGRVQIEARASELADRAIKIWPAPAPPVGAATDQVDWSRLHAAVVAVPGGCWTAHADLAALIGTSAAAVETHVTQSGDLPRAYRVLTHEGRVANSFAWADPSDLRNPVAVLEADGLEFDHSGAADSKKRMTADMLQAAITEMEPDEDLDDE